MTPTSQAGFTFLPENRSFKISGGGVAGLDFTVALGSLKVTITPKKAVRRGARWQVDKGFWMRSGVPVADLPAGPHTVTFKVRSDWITPPSQTVTIVAGETAPATGTYRTIDADFRP